MSAALTRRAALSGAVASVAMVGVAAAAPMPVASPAGISPELAALIDAEAEAGRACIAYTDGTYTPLAATARAKIAALPHATATIDARACSTANPETVEIARAIAGKCAPNEKRIYRDWRSFIAAAERRTREGERIWRDSGADAAARQSDALAKIWCAAGEAIGTFPASTPADLHAKLVFMVDHKMFDGMDWGAELLADAAHIAKVEG